MNEQLNPLVVANSIAYFSMELALNPAIPTYSGGLGVFAGDTIRSAADLGVLDGWWIEGCVEGITAGLTQLDTALDRVALAAPKLKKVLLEASVHVVSADGVIQEREAELLRAVADTLDCPIPPFVGTGVT